MTEVLSLSLFLTSLILTLATAFSICSHAQFAVLSAGGLKELKNIKELFDAKMAELQGLFDELPTTIMDLKNSLNKFLLTRFILSSFLHPSYVRDEKIDKTKQQLNDAKAELAKKNATLPTNSLTQANNHMGFYNPQLYQFRQVFLCVFDVTTISHLPV